MEHKGLLAWLLMGALIGGLCVGCGRQGESGGNGQNQEQGGQQGGDGGGQTTHTHTFSESWTSDESCHWHAATCGHAEETSGMAAHVFQNGVCSVCGYTVIDGNTDPNAIVSDKVTEEEWRAALSDDLIHNFKMKISQTANGVVSTMTNLFWEDSFRSAFTVGDVTAYELLFKWDIETHRGDFYSRYGEGWEHEAYSFESDDFPFEYGEGGTFFVGELPYLRENFSKVTYDEALGGYTFFDAEHTWANGLKYLIKIKNGKMCAFGALDPDDPASGGVGVIYDYGKLTEADFAPPTEYTER